MSRRLYLVQLEVLAEDIVPGSSLSNSHAGKPGIDAFKEGLGSMERLHRDYYSIHNVEIEEVKNGK